MTTETRAGGAWRIAVLAGRGGAEDGKERCMRPRSLHCLSAVFAVCVLLPVAVRAQVIPFAGNFGQGLAPSDNQMIFESVARLNAVEPSKVGHPTRGIIRSRRARAPPRYFGCSARVAWLATWCAIRLSQEGHRLATTTSPGAAPRPENGRSRADRPNVAPRHRGGLSALEPANGPKTA